MARRPENSPDPDGTSPDRGVLDEALEPEQIRSLNSALRRLSASDGGASKDMQEAAKRLLSGRLALRDALDDPAVARTLGGGGMASLRGQWESLSEEERERIRSGEAPPSGGSSSGSPSEPGRATGDSSRPGQSDQSGQTGQSGKKSPGRHSGGFSLY
ncbi:hypothetical protein [Streptomyces bluensis]|uniref:hypothetical protein n=1 Tax=Streptomyces bluensis TaxID=33897 RepID=UPI0010629888|nr:hypothetical protein [Streptomyces bluensis]GGZ67582.1 hypothetical protein GCM10010344_38300 [Streptomyces bluensis]